MDGTFQIQQLPPEVRSMIFRALPVEDVKSCRLTCPKWNDEIIADTLLMRKIYDAISPSSVIEEAYQGNLPFFHELVQFATNRNPANQWGTTPLHWAAMCGHLDVCQLLLHHVEVKDPVNQYGETPLHLAAMCGHRDVCQLLLDHVEVKDPADQLGYTPLHLAACYGRVDICCLLLDHVENKHPRNNDGETPLALAQKQGHGAVVELFAEN